MLRRHSLAVSAAMLAFLIAGPLGAAEEQDSTSVGLEAVSLSEADSILGRQHFYYSSLDKRDPFASLLSGEFEESGPEGLVDIDQVKLVGIMWGETDQFALVEDGQGYSYILREGDRVRYGTVIELEKDRLLAQIQFFGMTRTVVLRLEEERGQP